MEGLKEANVARETDVYLANPVLPDEILQGRTGLHCLLVEICSDKKLTQLFFLLPQRPSLALFAQQSTLLVS